jgi:hypothetical protein
LVWTIRAQVVQIYLAISATTRSIGCSSCCQTPAPQATTTNSVGGFASVAIVLRPVPDVTVGHTAPRLRTVCRFAAREAQQHRVLAHRRARVAGRLPVGVLPVAQYMLADGCGLHTQAGDRLRRRRLGLPHQGRQDMSAFHEAVSRYLGLIPAALQRRLGSRARTADAPAAAHPPGRSCPRRATGSPRPSA